MPETTAEQSWTPPVHDITADRADLPLYNRLYAATEELARSHMQESLRALTAGSLAQDVTGGLQALCRFMSDGPDTPDGAELEALESLDPAAVQALSSSLEAHLKKSAARLQRDDAAADRRVAQQMAAELSRSLWSTLLDHAARHASQGMVTPEKLLPAFPDGGVTSPLHDKLLGDLLHFNLPLEALVLLSHAALERVAEAEGAAAFLQLPQRLRVGKPELRSFLEAQKQKNLRAHQAVRAPKPRADKQPALSTQQIRAW